MQNTQKYKTWKYRCGVCTFFVLLVFAACNKHYDSENIKSVLYNVDFEQTYSLTELQNRDLLLLSKGLSFIGSPIVRSSAESNPINKLLSFFVTMVSHNKNAVKFLKITYWTVDAKRQPVLATAAVFVPQVPDGENKKYPILSVQHTSCQNRDASPSRLISNGPKYEIDNHLTESAEMRLDEALSSFGYIVVVADNIGLGDNYCVYPFGMHALATPIVDAIRAVEELDATGADAMFDGKNVALIGYSEGGYSSMVAAEMLQEQYSKDFNVMAAACMAGCFSISEVMINMFLEVDGSYSDPYIFPLFLNALSDQYGEEFPQFSLARMIKEKAPYDDRFFANLKELMLTFEGSSQINSLIVNGFGREYAEHGPKVILREDFIEEMIDGNSLLDSLLSLNDAYNWCPRMPLKIIHCIDDDMIPYRNSVCADSAFTAVGSTSVDFETFYDAPNLFGENMQHINSFFPIFEKGWTWLDDIVHPSIQ